MKPTIKSFLASTVLSVALISPAFADDQITLREIATKLEMAVDAKDWQTARAQFTDTITVDFTSLVGGEPATIPAEALIDGWSANLGPAKTSFHQRGYGVLTINGETAQLISNGYAWNRMEGNGDPLWEVWGTYTHDFIKTDDGWKIQNMALEVTHQRGNFWVRDTPAPQS